MVLTSALTIVTGDLRDATEQYIAHQCNCVTNHAAHLAKTIFTAFPYANIYSKRKQPDLLGSIVVCGDGQEQRYVINMLAQYYPGKPRVTDTAANRLKSFHKCLASIARELPELTSIAFPYNISCGAAGGNWPDYENLLTRFAEYIRERPHCPQVVLYKLPES